VPGPEHILIRRLADGVQLEAVGDLDLAWLAALLDGATLSASAAVLPAASQDQLAALLLRWTTAGVITSVTLAGHPAGESPS
jgi:hypothetical protein